jgi:C-terminal processing protease CtpA/Prc
MEINLFWIAAITALLASVYVWCRKDRISQITMLLVYILLACNIALALTALASLSDINVMDEGRHAATGLLLGGLLGFGTVAVIAARLSTSFPNACTWFALAATVMSFVVSKGYLATTTGFDAYVTIITVVACLIGFCLFSLYRRNFSANQSLAIVSLVFVNLFMILYSTDNTSWGKFLVSAILFLLVLFCLTSGFADNRIKRVCAGIMLTLVMLVLASQFHNLLPVLPKVVAQIPPFLACLLLIAWIRYQREALPACFYAASLVMIALFVMMAALPSAWDDDLLPCTFAVTLVLFVLSAWWYGGGASRGFRNVLRCAWTGFCAVSIIAIFAKGICFPLALLVHNSSPTRQLAQLHGTIFWPGNKVFLRIAFMDEYLWARESKPFARLKANATADETVEGVMASPDRYSYLLSKEDRENTDNGLTDMAGIHLVMVNGLPVVKYVTESSIAAQNGLTRGDRVLAMNGRLAQDRLKEPSWASIIDKRQSTTLTVKSPDGHIRKVIVQKRRTEEDLPFGNIYRTSSGKHIGYLYFNKFEKPQIESLDPIFAWFQKAGIRDLVVDLRYNGGGAARASQLLASLLIGARHDGDLFIHTEHSWRYHKKDSDVLIEKQKLSLNIQHLAVLTTGETASASEEFILGLKPYIKVITVGQRTYGKPYSMDPIAFGDTQLLMITGQMYNSKGETYATSGIRPDIMVKDDLNHQLGDPREWMLQAALDALDIM